MRPIKLKIKGLNSFIEEQIIDFDKLTDRGLFGIFGPTGSGKSTVLDGITLALYGEVARKSSNYINTNVESAHVSFEFQISGAETKRYLVEREFKTDKKSGNPRSGKCKISDITTDEPIILSESVSGVTSNCKEIIGLNLEDFTRTVVLPQGKFSEFLKLEGKPRREMLERLFNLQQYGDELSTKLSREIAKEKTENSMLSGELKGYEDINQNRKIEKEEEFEIINKKLEAVTEEVKILEKQFLENQDLWNLQIELNQYKARETELRNEEKNIEGIKVNINEAESAVKVMPYIEAYKITIKGLEGAQDKAKILKENLDVFKLKKAEIEIQWKDCMDRKENELYNLKITEKNLKDAIEEKKVIEALNKEISELQEEIVKFNQGQIEKQDQIKSLEQKKENIKSSISSSEKTMDELKVDNILKDKVQQGVLLVEKYTSANKAFENTKLKKESLEKSIAQDKKSESQINLDYNKKRELFKEKKLELDVLVKNCPGEQEDLLKLQKELSESTECWNKYDSYMKDKENSQKEIEKYTAIIQQSIVKRSQIEDNIKRLKELLKALEAEKLACKLRESLEEGAPCPVCGSRDHHKEDIFHVESKDQVEDEKTLELNERELKSVEGDISNAEANISLMKKKIKEDEELIAALGEDFKKVPLKDLEKAFENLSAAVKNYNEVKPALDLALNEIKEEGTELRERLNSIKALILRSEKELAEVSEKYSTESSEMTQLKYEYKILVEETEIKDFREKNREILQCEAQRDELSKKIKSYRIQLEELTLKGNSLQEELNILKEKAASGKTSLKEKEKNKSERILGLQSKTPDMENIPQLLMRAQNTIKEIEDNFFNTDKLKNEIDEKHQLCNEKYIEIMVKVSELTNRLAMEKDALGKALKEQNLQSIEETERKLIDRNTLGILKTKVEQFNEELAKTKGAIDSVLSKIHGREFTEEAWNEIQENKGLKEKELQEINEEKIRVEEDVKLINQKLIDLADLMDKKDKLDHKLGMLKDLETLFKGKKFVEFVAATRLKYISIEASKRLSEITNGSYGLEVDDNGKFIIRDYKNGGASRDASTLSGGETFLTSLALALALSAEIQLKGTAPLELFFLDEGFGTLDDNLLEVVMGSLEKIHNDKLKVGIISHVESIKNRVPVKLMLTPAESGKGGSKVRIERS